MELPICVLCIIVYALGVFAGYKTAEEKYNGKNYKGGMIMIYARIKANKGIEILFKPSNHDDIYDAMMEFTGNDHEISADAASWCEFATVGETYEFREGEIEIVEVD